VRTTPRLSSGGKLACSHRVFPGLEGRAERPERVLDYRSRPAPRQELADARFIGAPEFGPFFGEEAAAIGPGSGQRRWGSLPVKRN
jgi:hypothetical protein